MPIKAGEFERRLNEIYRPYHAALLGLLKQKRDRFGYAILLCAHSMPSTGRVGHIDSGSVRASIVPGSRGRTTAAARVVDLPDELARKRGWSVAHDVPYRGGFATVHYGHPAHNVHAIQVEINRQLYMREDTLSRAPGGFHATQAYCEELVSALGAISREELVR
jgi:N-formylglutamate amidohydrolase